jgi:hypothetical protein
MKHRHMFSIGTGDGVDRAEFTHAKGRAHGAHTFDPGIAIGGVGRIQLVGAANPSQTRVMADRIVHGEGIIPWHAKDIGDADVTETR